MSGLKLLSNERIIYKANSHWLFLLGPLTLLVLFGYIFLAWICPLWREFDLADLCQILLSTAVLLYIIIFYLDWRFNRFYLTNFRLIKERGIIGKKYISVWLVKIQDITCQFGIWGRILGFGDLLIESAGELGQVKFKGLPSSLKIQKMIEEQISKISSSLLYSDLQSPKTSINWIPTLLERKRGAINTKLRLKKEVKNADVIYRQHPSPELKICYELKK